MAVVVAWLAVYAAITVRNRTDCNIGSSTAGCDTVDEALLGALLVGLPALFILLGAIAIVTWVPKRRDRGESEKTGSR